ncbi:helix-turn-helix transcriptional regulator [Anaerobacillus sp. CMMVII]|uniref:helix-turn-helix domain-containing protein n=1 Tax=Anaerobacillus sp. CMMVII TaxID=2755588 RepID=UPI0021B80C85|nr:helix-turn-helix transcriptional regulator [Anaerobacillus sp. CMMVII]MCT8136469.1 helix-turn-helix transcriptional regulator [Anaerobacillus sp. CMMVII]
MYGTRIRNLRKEKKLTLKQLSKELGISFTALGNYEREDRQPNFETFEAIANYFDVSIDYLVGRRDVKTLMNTFLITTLKPFRNYSVKNHLK